MQSISFATPETGVPRENQRNYVFVDEHNRHKRLKVMRACEGCRRRKIKCDAATTNTWPCSACVRLKLPCVPPMVQYDRDFNNSTEHQFDNTTSADYRDDSSGSGDDDYNHHPVPQGRKKNNVRFENQPQQPQQAQQHHQLQNEYAQMTMPDQNVLGNSGLQYSVTHHSSPDNVLEAGLVDLNNFQHAGLYRDQLQMPQNQWANDDAFSAAATDVSDVLEQLKIDERGVANYINAQGRRLAETPAYEPWADEFEENPSFIPGSHEYAVKIHPADMPSEPEAADLLDTYFRDVHPYLPIVNKAAFYRQWNTCRESISPLLLETIFATAGRISDQPMRGMKWISMATKHVDCFMDVPRLSTVQALLLLLKARESAPQRGYFFRSWMSIVSIITMARDLGLDRHHELHKSGGSCGDNATECLTRTRVWQACFACELMISAPQGRMKMQVDPESVDLKIPHRSQEMEDRETDIHRNFVYFVYLIRNIRRANDIHMKLRADPSWRNDPEFTDVGTLLNNWANALPMDLKINVPTDLNIPCPPITHHYPANLQIYFHLANILVHRPPLSVTKTFTNEGQWKLHMTACSNAAKKICRLTEVVWNSFSMKGLQCMMRGINFTIYANLTATMIHLIASTCPDPEFNSDAKEYFTRSMRILENCIDISASAETKGQIQALREAFSLDLNRPFELNPNFPFYQPVQMQQQPQQQQQQHQPHLSPDLHLARASAYTPPQQHHDINAAGLMASGGGGGSPSNNSNSNNNQGDSPAAVHAMVMLQAGGGARSAPPPPPSQQVPIDPMAGLGWNPSRIFESWNTAMSGINGPPPAAVFSTPPAAFHPSPTSSTSSSSLRMRTHHHGGGTTGRTLHPPSSSHHHHQQQHQQQQQQMQHAFVSPGMWQDSVAAVYADTRRPMYFGGGAGGAGTGVDAAAGWVAQQQQQLQQQQQQLQQLQQQHQ